MFKSEVRLLKNENAKQLMSLKEGDRKNINSIMKSMSIFKINSYDAQVIIRDLIGMSQELELRGSSLEQSVNSDFTGFVKDIIENSAGPSIWEIITGFLLKLSGNFFICFSLLSIGAYSSFSWESSSIIFPLYFGMTLIVFITEGIVTPLFSVRKGYAKHIPSFISLVFFLGLAGVTFLLVDNVNTVPVNGSLIIGVSGLSYIILSYLNIKNINRLSIGKNNFIDDLITK
ncbi:hypothetical protein [Proteiniclasticum sp.]|uniref:hypothetical protein n=1 Tax=Proteiniclasticum sp. TaxID=2053595 RepID=UPI002899A290|nr:hypothetical protein [Proteiniclasticum sp.]